MEFKKKFGNIDKFQKNILKLKNKKIIKIKKMKIKNKLK